MTATDDDDARALHSALTQIEHDAPFRPGFADRVLDAAHADVAHTDNRRARSRWRAPLAAAILIALVATAIAVLSDRTRHTTPDDTITNTQPTWHNYLGVRFRVPASWQAVPVTFTSLGVEEPLGYLTNQSTKPECDPPNGCGPPVRHLDRGGIVVDISEGPGYVNPAGVLGPNSRVAGLPARRTAHACSAVDCPTGGTTEETVTILLPAKPGRAAENLVLDATVGADGAALLRAFDTMLAHAQGPHIDAATSLDSVSRARIVRLVHTFEHEGGGQVARVEVVRSTHHRAVVATMDGDEVPGTEPVWVVELTAATAFHPDTKGAPGVNTNPSVKYAIWVLTLRTFQTTDSSLGNHHRNLAVLGSVTSFKPA